MSTSSGAKSTVEGATAPGKTGRKPRLLVLTSTYPRWANDHEPGFVHELTRRLAEQFETRVIAPHAPGAARHEVIDGVEIHRFRYAPFGLETLVNDGGITTNLRQQPWKWLLVPLFFTSLLLATRRQLKRFRPDVVHAHWLIPQGLVMALLSKFRNTPPFLLTSHGADLFALRSRPMVVLKRFVARRAGSLTVVSQAMAEELQRIGVEMAKIGVRPMGADLSERFTPGESATRDDHEILFVGRLVEKKGLKYLISAMPEIVRQHPEARLTIAGYGPEESALREQAKSLGLDEYIHFLGAVPQERLPELYRRAAVFVAPFVRADSGDQEGLGLVTIEAIGCGCPAIISRLPGTRSVPAIKVTPGNSDELLKAVAGFLASDVDARKAEAARQRERVSRFDWAFVTTEYYQALAQMANQSKTDR